MYRLIPTQEDPSDEDNTESGSVQTQNGYRTHSQPKSRLHSFFRSIHPKTPAFLKHTFQWATRHHAPPRPTHHASAFTLPTKKQEYRFDSLFLKRFRAIVSVLFAKRSKVLWIYVGMTLFICLNEGIVYYVGTIPSRYYKVLGDKDSAAFFRLLIVSLLTVFMAGFGKSVIFLLGNLLGLECRRTLTTYLHQIYIQPKLFYRILAMHEDIDNPDQRITQDVEKLATSITKLVESLAIIPLLIGFYTWQCYVMAGYVGPLAVYGYFVLSSISSRFLINPIVDAIFYKESAEGYFRFLHVRFRQFAESIAFSRGEVEARDNADDSLEVLLTTQLNVIYRELPLEFLTQSVSYFGSILSYVIIAVPIFMGKYDDLPSSDISAIISKISFVSMYLTYQFSKIIKCASDFSDIAGYTSRLGQLMEALDDLSIEMENIAIDFPHEGSISSDTSVQFENVSFCTPAGDLVVKDFSISFSQGINTIIVGPNGAGKTSILRAMAGLWPTTRGQITLPQRYRKDLIFLPQSPYMTYGTMREQLVYPLKDTASSVSDQDILRVLKLARLERLVDVIEDFDVPFTQEWTKMLSPGEQQKMVFARLLYARPMFAVLDEATSSMDSISETEMFKQCRLLNITCITVSHNSSVEQYHSQKIVLDGQGGWEIVPLQRDLEDDPEDDAERNTLAD